MPLAYLRQNSEAPPVWSVPGVAAFADDMRVVGKGVLVGWTEQQKAPPFFRIAPREYVLYDAATGATLWRVPRNPTGNSVIIATEPLLALLERAAGASTLNALNPTTGAVLFSRTLGEPSAIIAASTDLITASTHGTGLRLEALDTSGKSIWQAEQAAGDAPRLTVSGHDVLVRTPGRACAYTLLDGHQEFCVEGLGAALNGTIPLHTNGLWMLQTARADTPPGDGRVHRGDGETIALDDKGTVRWRVRLPETERALNVAGDLLLVREKLEDGLAPGASAESHLVAVKIGSGEVLWKSENLKEGFSSEPLVDGRQVFLSTAMAVWVFDLKTGKTAHTEKTEGMWPRLGDRIVARGENVVFLSETAALALRRKTLVRTWAYAVRGGFGPIYGNTHARWAALSMSLGGSANLAQTERELQRASEHLDRAIEDINRDMSQAALRNQDASYHATHHGEANLYGAAAVGLMAVETNLMVAMVEEKFRAGANAASLSFARATLDHSVALQALELQGDYYVRPVEWLFGQGVFLLNLMTGQWRELITGPPENFSNAFLMHFPLALVGPEGAVVTAGIGLEPQQWVPDTRFYDYNTVVKSLLSFKATRGHGSDSYVSDSLLAPNTFDITPSP